MALQFTCEVTGDKHGHTRSQMDPAQIQSHGAVRPHPTANNFWATTWRSPWIAH